MKVTQHIRRVSRILVLLAATLWIVGCTVHEKENSSGGKDVSINSPVGGLKVRTDDVQALDTGMKPYPGARFKPKSDNNDSKANVNIDTPWFGLKVVALKFESDDSPDKIWDFYKKDMAKYGRVLECKPGSPDLKFEARDKEDLTCEDKSSRTDHTKTYVGNLHDYSDGPLLKVGTNKRMHIVAVKPSGKGAEFSLVYVVVREGKEPI